MKVLPNPESRLVWAFVAVGVSVLLMALGANHTASVLIGMACGYLVRWYLRNKAAESKEAEDAHPLTSLSLSTPTEKPKNEGGKQGAA